MSLVDWTTTACNACSSRSNMSSKMTASGMFSTGTAAEIFINTLVNIPASIGTRALRNVAGDDSLVQKSLRDAYDVFEKAVRGSSDTVQDSLQINLLEAAQKATQTAASVPVEALMAIYEAAMDGFEVPMEALTEVYNALVM